MNDDHDAEIPRVRLAWGRRGAYAAAERGDILVVVDTLRFSTAAATAVHHGALIYPCAPDEALYTALAQRVGGEVALHHAAAPTLTRFSLSPRSFLAVEPGTRVVLPSPNGSTCSQYGSRAPALFVGALVNAQAVAGAVSHLLNSASHRNVTVLACGERWRTPDEEGALRCALEDYLGAGAILSALPFSQTVEAQMCAAAFRAMEDQLDAALWECESGQELRAKGLGEDVRFAAQLNVYDTAPVLRGERLEAFVADEGRVLG
ncbi:MAG TPA: 2-phosphosulfolactate phosphatase [Ktedonobacterales bacterium]|jgi:2-phosphosulfolactate phosphatase